MPLTGTWTINPFNISGTERSDTISGLTVGTYVFTVTNEIGCTSVSSSNVVINTQPETPTATITTTSSTTFCQGDSIILNANTGIGLGYKWMKGFYVISGATSSTYTTNESGSYRVIVKNSDRCVDMSQALIIKVNPLPTVNVLDITINSDSSGMLTAYATGVSYIWQNGETTQSIIVNSAGRIIVLL